MRILTALVLTGFCLNAAAGDILVGDRTIDIPLPEGFVELTPDMSPYYESMWAYIAPSNNRYLTLVEESRADAMRRGETIDVGRYMNIETEKSISRMSISAAQFDELQNVLRNQLFELTAKLEELAPEMLDAGNASLSEQFDTDLAIEFGGVVPFPIHHDTDNAIASSMYMTIAATVNGEAAETEVLAATMLTLHVGDKVLFLYVYGPQPDLIWTRQIAAAWADRIVAANSASSQIE